MKNKWIEGAREKVLLKSREAAARLSISERQLWAMTRPRGQIPAVRIGNCVRYDPLALDRYIADQQSVASTDCD